MKRQLRGMALLLVSILLMIGYGNKAFFSLSLRWSEVFAILGIVGVMMVFIPDKED